MLKRHIIILSLSIVVVIFAIQNVDKVDIQLLMLDFNASLSLVIILTFFIGAILSLVLAFQETKKRNHTISELKDEMKRFKKTESTSKKNSDDLFQSKS